MNNMNANTCGQLNQSIGISQRGTGNELPKLEPSQLQPADENCIVTKLEEIEKIISEMENVAREIRIKLTGDNAPMVPYPDYSNVTEHVTTILIKVHNTRDRIMSIFRDL